MRRSGRGAGLSLREDPVAIQAERYPAVEQIGIRRSGTSFWGPSFSWRLGEPPRTNRACGRQVRTRPAADDSADAEGLRSAWQALACFSDSVVKPPPVQWT